MISLHLWSKTRVAGLGVLMSLVVATTGAAQRTAGDRTGAAAGSLKERIARIETELAALGDDVADIMGSNPPAEIRERLESLEASVNRLSADVAEMTASNWRRDDDEAEQDARLDDLVEETGLMWKDIEAARAEAKALLHKPLAGYDGGFYIRSGDDAFRLAVKGFIRPSYQLVIQAPVTGDDGDGADDPRLSSVAQNGFGLENARAEVAVHVMDMLSGRLEIDYGRDERNFVAAPYNDGHPPADTYTLELLDAYGEYAPLDALTIRAGQFKVPFDEETRFLDNQLLFTTRGLPTRAYLVFGDSPYLSEDAVYYHRPYERQRGASFGRDLGVGLGGRVLEGRFNYEAGVFNGSGLGRSNDNRDVLAAVRLFSDPLGPMTDGMSDVSVSRTPLLRVGVGYAFDLLRHENQLAPGATYNSADNNVTADLHLKWMGASALVSVFFRHSDHGGAIFDRVEGDGGDTTYRDKPLQSMGVAGQVAYFHAGSKLEPAVRYALYDARLHLIDDHVHEVTGALGYRVILNHLVVRAEYRGLFPADTSRSYLAPLGETYPVRHEATVLAEVSF